jgi:hypothetical protein
MRKALKWIAIGVGGLQALLLILAIAALETFLPRDDD